MRVLRVLVHCVTALPVVLAADFQPIHDTEKGAPMSAQEAAATMQLPPGFRCVVFAAEPDVRQPIAMAWDPRGRLWVAENYSYAENPARWDTKLRDRILVFEDTDGDGKHDRRSVFWEQGSQLTSLEIGYGGVWILHKGTLSFLADRNGDDIPDAEPEVVLDGFNVKSVGHNIVNGLRWGPDGWLYGRHGILDTSMVGAPGTPLDQRVRINCGIWRYHPTRKVFEVVCHGGTNSWGHDWNAEGDLFWINTVIGHLWHGIPGAHYRRMFGMHLNPHVYESIEQTADHFHWDTGAEKWSDIRKLGVTGKTDQLGGGHAHVGMLIYEGNAWPEKYRGAVLTCNLHGNRINMDTLQRDGCGYTGKHAPDFMKARDTWFRGIDLLTGPDGNVFVADWSDAGECHDNDGVHRNSGRIYKIVYDGADAPRKRLDPITGRSKPAPAFADLWAEEAGDSGTRVWDEGGWWSRMARQIRNERTNLRRDSLPVPRVEFTHEWADLPASPDPAKGGWYADFARRVLEGGFHREPRQRLRMASLMQRLPLKERWDIARQLVTHAEDASDRQQPLMIWYGIEPAVAAEPLRATELIRDSKIPAVRRLVARRLSEMIEEQPAAMDALVEVLKQRADLRPDVIAGMAAGLEGFASVKKPREWNDALVEAWSGSDSGPAVGADPLFRESLRQVALVFGSGRAAGQLMDLVKNANADANARLNAFKNLTRSANPELLPVIRSQLNDRILGAPARRALAAYDDPEIPGQLVAAWPERNPELQAATVTTLTSRPAFAFALLEAVRDGRIPRAAINPFQARQIRLFGEEPLTKLLSEVWGEIRDTPEAKKAEFARWESVLRPESVAKADRAQGRAVFQTVCGACHKMFGQGGGIGPELTGSDRRNLRYLLENILDPNAVVPADFRVSSLRLKDGRTVSGVIPEQNARTITIQTPTERLTIERSQIERHEQLSQSLMPEGLLAALGEQNGLHLMAYLMGEGQVDLPK